MSLEKLFNPRGIVKYVIGAFDSPAIKNGEA